MTIESPAFTLAELAELVDLPQRTVRYYIQIGLIARPGGVGRGAHYTAQHVDQLLEIKKWQAAGLSLERIGELLAGRSGEALVPPPQPRQPGSVEVWSHLVIADGLELTLDPKRAGLSPEQVRALAQGVMTLYSNICADQE